MWKRSYNIGEILLGTALSLCGIPAEELVVSNTIQLVDDVFDTMSSAEKIAALQQAIADLQSLMTDLQNVKDSLTAVPPLIGSFDDIPEILPSLYLNLISVESIDSVNQLADSLLQLNDVQSLRDDVNQFVSFTQQYTQAVINWYLLEMKIQSYQGQQNIALSSINSLTYLLQEQENEEELYIASFYTAFQFKVGATFRILIDMLYLQRQYNYYSLSDFSFDLGFNPHSTEISNAQLKLYNTIIAYVSSAQQPETVTIIL